jgi:hypothetical protein
MKRRPGTEPYFMAFKIPDTKNNDQQALGHLLIRIKKLV